VRQPALLGARATPRSTRSTCSVIPGRGGARRGAARRPHRLSTFAQPRHRRLSPATQSSRDLRRTRPTTSAMDIKRAGRESRRSRTSACARAMKLGSTATRDREHCLSAGAAKPRLPRARPPSARRRARMSTPYKLPRAARLDKGARAAGRGRQPSVDVELIAPPATRSTPASPRSVQQNAKQVGINVRIQQMPVAEY